MRTRLLVGLLGVSVAALAACSSAEGEEVGRSDDSLARRGIYDPPPAKTVRPPVYTPPPGILDPGSFVCSPVRYDVRRATRACADLPGVQNDVLPAIGGQWRVAQLPTPASMPATLAQRMCSYTWEPAGCADQDWAKLQLQSNESVVNRGSKCTTMSCVARTSNFSKVNPNRIPSGVVGCPTCGVTSGNHLYAVIPPESTFRYILTDAAGNADWYWLYRADLDPAASTDVTVAADILLPQAYPEQTVELMPL